MKNITLKLIVIFGLIAFFDSCTNDDDRQDRSTRSFSHKVASDWFEMTKELTKVAPGFSPPVASRAFGYSGIA